MCEGYACLCKLVDGFLMHYQGFSSVLLDGSTLSLPSLHVWKVAANSAIDTQIQVLMVYVHTCMYQRGLFGSQWYHHHPVQGKHYLNTARSYIAAPRV